MFGFAYIIILTFSLSIGVQCSPVDVNYLDSDDEVNSPMRITSMGHIAIPQQKFVSQRNVVHMSSRGSFFFSLNMIKLITKSKKNNWYFFLDFSHPLDPPIGDDQQHKHHHHHHHHLHQQNYMKPPSNIVNAVRSR